MKKYAAVILLLIAGFLRMMAVAPSGTLPVMYINVESGREVVDKETYLTADYWLDPKGTEGVEAFGSQTSPLTMKIKGRGNYSFVGFDKKPYRIKLDKKAALLGMKASKHFGLLAHADDSRGFLRNTIGFRLSELVGLPWTPKQQPVELVVNGTYRGLYFLTELIRIDSNRVNITEWTEEDSAGNPLVKWGEGGTIVEIDNYDEPGQIQFTNPGAGDVLRFTYDKSVDPGFEPDGYIDWLKSSLGKINDIILHGDRESDELWKYIDIDDLARFILVQELTDNYESFHGSCYIYRDLGENEKWHFSPVWDFGSAFQRRHPDHSFYLQASGNPHYNHWVGELLEFPALRQKMADHWTELSPQLPELYRYADNFISTISSAAATDLQRWPDYGNDRLTDKLTQVKSCLSAGASFINRDYGVGGPDEKEFFVVGHFNGWTNMDYGWKFTSTSRGYEYLCTVPLTGEWKINDGSWDINFGQGASNMVYDETYPLVKDGANIKLDVPAGANIVFVYNPEGTSSLLIESTPSGIADVATDADIRITTAPGVLTVSADRAVAVTVTDIIGRNRTYDVGPGVTRIPLQRGIYIINGCKYRL